MQTSLVFAQRVKYKCYANAGIVQRNHAVANVIQTTCFTTFYNLDPYFLVFLIH